jgi:hypothetical protein
MTSSSHHVACVTDDAEAVHTFLTEVIGLDVHLEFRTSGEAMTQSAGWPQSNGANVRMYGTPPAGIVEVIAIPDELRGQVAPKIWLTSFATPDLDARIEAARRLGFAAADATRVDTGEVDISISMVDVGGICWEMVAFHR